MSAPPFTGVTGIFTVDDKHQAVSKADYDGHAKPGQLIVDTSDYTLWIGTPSGSMVPSSTAVGGPVANAIHAVTSGAANSVAGANVTGEVNFAATANTVAGANVTGEVMFAATANTVAGANVTGEVMFAATANTVAGANVTGEVNFAAVANTVAGANVTGEVNFAIVANSVAGANVSGEVAFAATANTVAGANVSGEVSFAAIANSVAGANVSGEVSFAAVANSVAGANVTGAVAFATVANSVAGANVSGEVSFAAIANSVAGANVVGIVSLAAAIDATGAADILIAGGALGEVLKSDGAGGMVWAQSDVPAGANTEIQFNNDGVFGSDANLLYDNTLQTLTVTGNVVTDTLLTGNSFTQFTSVATTYVEVAEIVATNQIDITKGNFFSVEVTGPITLDVINSTIGPGPFVVSFVLEVKDGGINVSWWPNIIWAGGSTPALTTTGTDVLAFYSVGGTAWRGFILALDMK
jgi:hypothetical protein